MQFNLSNRKIEGVADIVAILSEVEQEALVDGLANYHETQELIKVVDFATISANPELNNLTYYCTKTGQPLSQIAPDSFVKMQDIVGNDLANEMFKRKSIEQVSTHWLFTDESALDKLSKIDPYGYFVYSAFFVIRPDEIVKYYTHLKQNKENYAIEARWNELRNKIKFWQIIQSIAIKDILEINELMRRYLALIHNTTLPDTIQLTYKLMTGDKDTLDIEAWKALLKNNIKYIIIKAYRKHEFKKDITYADVVTLQGMFKGFSNFRGQRKLRRHTNTENVMMLLRDFITDIPEHQLRPAAFWHARTPPRTKSISFKGTIKLAIKTDKKQPKKLSFVDILKKKG